MGSILWEKQCTLVWFHFFPYLFSHFDSYVEGSFYKLSTFIPMCLLLNGSNLTRDSMSYLVAILGCVIGSILHVTWPVCGCVCVCICIWGMCVYLNHCMHSSVPCVPKSLAFTV